MFAFCPGHWPPTFLSNEFMGQWWFWWETMVEILKMSWFYMRGTWGLICCPHHVFPFPNTSWLFHSILSVPFFLKHVVQDHKNVGSELQFARWFFELGSNQFIIADVNAEKCGWFLHQKNKTKTGWWFEPLWKILVIWDDYPQYMEKYKMFQTTNQKKADC